VGEIGAIPSASADAKGLTGTDSRGISFAITRYTTELPGDATTKIGVHFVNNPIGRNRRRSNLQASLRSRSSTLFRPQSSTKSPTQQHEAPDFDADRLESITRRTSARRI
jgi:hypothetical protein